MKKAIMSKAWEIYKATGCTQRCEFALCLTMAWEIVRKPVAKTRVIEIEVKYWLYKKEWQNVGKTIANSYDAANKTIRILVDPINYSMERKAIDYSVSKGWMTIHMA